MKDPNPPAVYQYVKVISNIKWTVTGTEKKCFCKTNSHNLREVWNKAHEIYNRIRYETLQVCSGNADLIADLNRKLSFLCVILPINLALELNIKHYDSADFVGFDLKKFDGSLFDSRAKLYCEMYKQCVKCSPETTRYEEVVLRVTNERNLRIIHKKVPKKTKVIRKKKMMKKKKVIRRKKVIRKTKYIVRKPTPLERMMITDMKRKAFSKRFGH